MIEIKKRNENWEAYYDGGLMTYNENLATVLNYLVQHCEEIEEEQI